MKNISNSLLVICLSSLLILFGCESKQQLEAQPPELGKYESPQKLVKKYYEILYSWSQFEDVAYFYRTNRTEILKNLEIVELIENENVAIAFIRFSVGTSVYRNALWFRKIENKYWYIINYVSKYNAEDDNYLKDKMEWVEKMIDKEDKWEENSASMW